jgi:uncharacterized protein (DUF2062 family)
MAAAVWIDTRRRYARYARRKIMRLDFQPCSLSVGVGVGKGMAMDYTVMVGLEAEAGTTRPRCHSSLL